MDRERQAPTLCFGINTCNDCEFQTNPSITFAETDFSWVTPASDDSPFLLIVPNKCDEAPKLKVFTIHATYQYYIKLQIC